MMIVPLHIPPATLSAFKTLADRDVYITRRDTHDVQLRPLYLTREKDGIVYENLPTYEIGVSGRVVGYLHEPTVLEFPMVSLTESIKLQGQGVATYLTAVAHIESGFGEWTPELEQVRATFLEEARKNAEIRSREFFGALGL